VDKNDSNPVIYALNDENPGFRYHVNEDIHYESKMMINEYLKSHNMTSLDEAWYDDQLGRSLVILQRIHYLYYHWHKFNQNYGNTQNSVRPRNGETDGENAVLSKSLPSVRAIITAMKAQVLHGCELTFSGIIPINDPKPQNHYLWRLSRSLGAKISMTLTPATTHLVTTQSTTSKVTKAATRPEVR
jgi:hypothetical protein